VDDESPSRVVSLDEEDPENIADSDGIVHRINEEDFGALVQTVRTYVREHGVTPVHSVDDVRLLAIRPGYIKGKRYELDEEGSGLMLRDWNLDKGVRTLAGKFQSAAQAHR